MTDHRIIVRLTTSHCKNKGVQKSHTGPTLREECRLRVFENRILGRIFGPKRDANGEWRRLHNEQFYSFYRSPNIVRDIKSRISR